MSRKMKRITQKSLRGRKDEVELTFRADVPRGFIIPNGTELKNPQGLKMKTVKTYRIKKRWWWSIRLFFNKNWRVKATKIPVVYL